MKAQLTFSMLFMLSISAAFALLTAALFCGVIGGYSRGIDSIASQRAAVGAVLRDAAALPSGPQIIANFR